MLFLYNLLGPINLENGFGKTLKFDPNTDQLKQ